MGERRWKVGELAQATGVTVRTLHHFDEIGLLRPSERSDAGHRHYTSDDVRQLYRVLALRQLGMQLSDIAESLAGDVEDLQQALRRQLAQAAEQLAAAGRLRRRLLAILHAVQQAKNPSIDQLIETMEAMMGASFFSQEQLAQLKERHREVSGETFAGWQQRWAALSAEAGAQAEEGTDPGAPEVQALARRWSALMTEMTGGDLSVLSSMYAKLDGKGAPAATRGVVSAEAWEHIKRAFAVGYGLPG